MYNKSVLKILSLLMVISMLLAACAPKTATEEPTTTTSTEPKRVKIGAIVPTLNAQFWNRYYEFMKQGADELGVDLVLLNADNNADSASKYIEDLVSQKVDGIIMVPYWSLDKKALADTKAANIPLIFTDVYSSVAPQDPANPNYLAFVGPSDEDAGYQMGLALFEATEADADGKKVIGWVEGTAGTSVAIDRNKGLEKALAEHPEVVVAGKVNGNFVRDESQAAFEALYQAHPEIKGVWAANGGTATGVMTAIKNAGKVPGKDIMVVAMDLNPENVDAVKSGELLFDIGGHWLQGGFALVMMYDFLNGLPLTAAEANVKLGLLPLTKALVPQFEKDFPDGVPAYNFKEHSRVYTPGAPAASFEMKYSAMPTTTTSTEPKRVKIGAIVPTLNAQFWNRYYEFMKKGADELGVDLVMLNADNNADQASKYIEDLISQSVDGIIMVPYWSLDKKALADTKAANIPLIFTDVYSSVAPQDPTTPNYLAFVGPSDEDAGYQMGLALFAATEADADGKKVIGWVEGTAGTSVAIDRNKGLEKALAEHPEVVVAGKVNGNFVRDESQAAFEALYQAHPEIKGVWAANGGTATGVMTAIKNAGKVPGKDIMVVAMDLNPENVDAVKSGELLFDIGGHWLQGGFALVMMYDYLNGLPLTAAEANVKLGLLPLTIDKIPAFEACFPGGVPTYNFKEHSRVYTPKAPAASFEMKYCQ